MIALPVLLQTAAAISTMADPLQPATENVNSTKGPPDSQKLMNFRKTSKQPLTTSPPPALVSENDVALFSGGTKICNEIFRIGVTPPGSRAISPCPIGPRTLGPRTLSPWHIKSQGPGT